MSETNLPTTITTQLNPKSLGRLINPFSSFMGSGQEYTPQWLINLFKSGNPKDFYTKNKGAQKTAHILAKIGAGAAVFGGAAWLLRSIMHTLDVDNIQSLKSNARASQKLETVDTRPVQPALTEVKQPEVQQEPEEQEIPQQNVDELKKQSFLDPYHVAYGAVPPIIALAAMLTSFKLADKHYDTKLGKTLDKELDEAEAQSNMLAYNRVAKNRGLPTVGEEDFQKEASLVKQEGSWLPRGIETPMALVLAALAVTGGFVGFNWQQANSPAVAKYKAYKKGLETYNKNRVLGENVESSPLDPSLLEYLDTNLNQNQRKAGPTVETSSKELFID